MSEPAPPMVPYNTQDFLSERTLELADQAVQEFFDTMLGLPARPMPATNPVEPCDPTTASSHDLRARVHFTGQLDGACEVRISPTAAGFIATLLLGMPIDEEDESIGDTVGELCNIIGGGWKNRACLAASRCSLSPPTILTDAQDVLDATDAHLSRTYAFDEHTLCVTLARYL